MVINWNNDSSIRTILKSIHLELISLDTYSYIRLGSLHKNAVRLFHSLFVFENYPALNEYKELNFRLMRVVEKLDYDKKDLNEAYFRNIKEQVEIKKIKKACAVTALVAKEIKDELCIGITELEVKKKISRYIC